MTRVRLVRCGAAGGGASCGEKLSCSYPGYEACIAPVAQPLTAAFREALGYPDLPQALLCTWAWRGAYDQTAWRCVRCRGRCPYRSASGPSSCVCSARAVGSTTATSARAAAATARSYAPQPRALVPQTSSCIAAAIVRSIYVGSSSPACARYTLASCIACMMAAGV